MSEDFMVPGTFFGADIEPGVFHCHCPFPIEPVEDPVLSGESLPW
jgi:hypothetical protein